MGGEGIHNPADLGPIETDLDNLALGQFLIFAEVSGLDGDAMRGTDDAALAAVCTEARLAELDAANIPADIDQLIVDLATAQTDITRNLNQQVDYFGASATGRAITATLLVSPDGDNTDGLSWRTAYQTINAAIDFASGDAADLTLIFCAPGTYDIDTTGDFSTFKNVEIRGSHRNWVHITNNHGSATSIMNFTGFVSLLDLTFKHGAGSLNGVKISGAGTKGSRVRRVYFEAENTTGAHTCLELEDTEYARVEDVKWHGTVGNTLGLLLDDCKLCNFETLDFHECLTGIQITNLSEDNIWSFILLHECALALDIDSGDNQFLHEFGFSMNTRNVDDEVGNHTWVSPRGQFDIELLPDNMTGILVNTGAAGVYGGDTELLSSVSRDNPFRVVGYAFDPSTTEWYHVRFSDDSGVSYFDIVPFFGTKQTGNEAPSGTEHIFNRGTRISCSARDVSGGDNVDVWLQIQEV